MMDSYLKYLLLLSCVTFIDGHSYNLVGSGNLWYKYHVVPATWSTARRICAIEGGILASPVTPLHEQVMRYFSSRRQMFTGLHSTYSEGIYYTVDGIPLESLSVTWAANEPNNIDNLESCLVMDPEGKLSDIRCESPRPYLCFKNQILPETVCGTPDSEYVFYKETNKCYKFHKKPEKFYDANFVCSAEGGHLAILNSNAEAGVIRNIISKHPQNSVVGEFWKEIVFVGFHNWGTGGDWRTIHGQTLAEAGYQTFAAKEPKMPHGAAKYCGAVFRDGTLDDTHCTNFLSFICEKEPKSSNTYQSIATLSFEVLLSKQ
ncbi:C-type mannose receptor 2-like [Anticarsia gemmatalis]|uniref:C-type mannose receptor 2-like n=1 Tax=Anticarsia gemmatalis TaxID=129554 RepID=UPI003F75AD2C